jgi:hypothetical protein
MKNATFSILVGIIGLMGCGDGNGRPGPCNECRQQNAPIESAISKSAELTGSSKPIESLKNIVSDTELNSTPGFSSIDLEQAARTQPSESLRKASDALISQQENDI